MDNDDYKREQLRFLAILAGLEFRADMDIEKLEQLNKRMSEVKQEALLTNAHLKQADT